MKAQFWSFDIIFALFIFIVAILVLTSVWLSISNQFAIANGDNTGSMQNELQQLDSKLLSTGSANWQDLVQPTKTSTWQNVSVGLGVGQGSGLSSGKIETLEAMSSHDYQATKPILGIAYDYYIYIALNGGLNITIGKSPQGQSATSVQVSSLPIIVAGQKGTLKTEIWTNTTFGIG